MSFYRFTRDAIRRDIIKNFPGARAISCIGKIQPYCLPNHLLWKAEEMEKWSSASIKLAVKAGQMAGRMTREMEELGIWERNISDKFLEEDLTCRIKQKTPL